METVNLTALLTKYLTISVPCILLLGLIIAIRSLLKTPLSFLHTIFIPGTIGSIIYMLFALLPVIVEDAINNSRAPVSDIHRKNAASSREYFDVADLHCDALLWGGRSLLKTSRNPLNHKHEIGTVDLPRLLQAATNPLPIITVNSVPRNINFDKNKRPTVLSDVLFTKTILESWPRRTWLSSKERVLHQAQRLHNYANVSNNQLSIVRSQKDLNPPLADKKHVHAILAVEGLSSLDNKLITVDQFFEKGIRILGPTHFFDTEVGGSSSGECNCGLTDFGRDVMKKMKAYRMIVDLAHASNQLMTDIMDLDESERPSIMLSHTGLKSVCTSNRNLNDENLLRITQTGGLVGIALFAPALCGGDLIESFVKTVRHAVSVVGGVDSLALGSDWDGAVSTPVTAADTHVLSTALIQIGGFTAYQVRKIMHDNAYEYFKKALPE